MVERSAKRQRPKMTDPDRRPKYVSAPPAERKLDQIYAAELDEASTKRRTALRSQVTGTLMLAAFAFVMAELVVNVDAFDAAKRPVEIHFVKITPADATVIVVGLLTVVAALNIALASWRDLPTQVNAEDFASGLVWADQLELMARLSAVIAFATALIQLPEFSDDNSAQTTFLLGLGAVAVLLSAAVFDWSSRKLPRWFIEQAAVENFERRISEWGIQLDKPVWPPRKAIAASMWFVGAISITASLVVFVIATGGLGQSTAAVWFQILRVFVLAALGAAVTTVLVWLTVKSWVDAKRRPEDRGLARPFRWLYVLIASLLLLKLTANYVSIPPTIWLIVGALEFFWLILPLVLMFLAKTRAVGPGRFAVHLRMIDAEKKLAQMKIAVNKERPVMGSFEFGSEG